jgi:phosphate transport system substrate-binding protein
MIPPPSAIACPSLIEEIRMFRSIVAVAAAAVLSAFASIGCNFAGEEPVKEKDFATSATVKTAVGAAGSTFIAPIMTNWVTAYQQIHPSTTINYRPIGSGAGLNELSNHLLGLAASDAPLSDQQISKMFPVIQVPVTAGAVCAIYNVPDVKSPLRFSASTLAGIFSGNIISWQDPAIERDNPGAKLPRAAVIVVHRSDGSGTTSIFSGYLSKVSPEWAKRAGQGLSVSWPVGIGVEGTKGMVEFVKQNPGTIGYAELSNAKQNKLAVADIQNRAGTFVAPSPASTTAAIEAFDEALTKDPRTPIVDPPVSAKDAYPLAGLTFLIVSKEGDDADGRQAIKDFIQFTVTTGQDSAESLDYAKLPKPLQQQDLALLGALSAGAQPAK